jgi:hypothetical protein
MILERNPANNGLVNWGQTSHFGCSHNCCSQKVKSYPKLPLVERHPRRELSNSPHQPIVHRCTLKYHPTPHTDQRLGAESPLSL